MSLRHKGLVLAMEEDLETLPASNEEVAESMVDVADGVAEVEDAAGEIASYDDAIDGASGDAETLEKIQDVMEDSVEKGEGLDETSAAIAEIAVESICARLGIQKRIMPSLESFGSSNSRVVATKIALESIGDSVKKAWEAIKAAYEKVKNYIIEFFKKYFTALGGAKRSYDAISKQVKEFGKTEKSEENLKNKSLATALTVGNAVDANSTTTILKNHEKLTTAGNVVIGTMEELARLLYEGPDKVQPENFSQFEDKVLKSGISVEDGLIGQTSLKAEAQKAGEGVRGFAIRLLSESKAVSKEEMPVLSKAEMEEVLKEVKTLLDATEKFVQNKSKVEAAFNSFFKGFDIMIKAAGKIASTKDNSESVGKTNKEVRSSVEKARGVISTVTTAIPSYNLRAIKAGLQYVSASMKAYK